MTGVLLALLAVACGNRVSGVNERAATRARLPRLPVAAADLLPSLSGPVEAVVAALQPAPAAAPAPALPAISRPARPQPTVLPDDDAAPRRSRPAPVRAGLEGLGQIDAPRMGLSAAFFEGVDQGTLAHGPGHWPDRAMPGHIGNVVLAGHRVTHTRPFHDIDLLQPGDLITFTTREGRFIYEMVDSFVVRPNDMWIADQTDTPTVTLFACHPKGSAAQRYVVRGRLISPMAPGAQQAAAPSAPAPPQDTPQPPPQDTPPPPDRRCTHILCIGG